MIKSIPQILASVMAAAALAAAACDSHTAGTNTETARRSGTTTTAPTTSQTPKRTPQHKPPAPKPTTPAPKPTTPAAKSRLEPKPTTPKQVTYTGTGDDVVAIHKPGKPSDPVLLNITGPTVEDNFVVETADFESGGSDAQLLVNTIGAYHGTVLLDAEEGQETDRLVVQAGGSWTIQVVPITSAPQFESSYRADGDAVVIYTGPAGSLTFTASGDDNFVVTGYGGSDYPDLMVNEIGAYHGTVPVGEGPVLLAVTASSTWTVTR